MNVPIGVKLLEAGNAHAYDEWSIIEALIPVREYLSG
jgi:hypothetical protein